MDSVLFVLLGFCAVEGYAIGAVVATFDLLQFIVSFVVGIKAYGLVALGLTQIFHVTRGYANVLGFFIAAICTEILLYILLRKTIIRAQKANIFLKSGFGALNNSIGILPGLLSGMVLLMFVLTVIETIPMSPFLKNTIHDSKIGFFLVSRSTVVEQEIAGAFGGVAQDTLNFLTIEPKSNSSISLGFKTDGAVDASAENTMLLLINQERAQRGLGQLSMDRALQKLARDYAAQMLLGGYFSHYTPDGLSPFDRMGARDIIYSYAGENLAFSANVDLAMQGLMNSPGHKANILSPNFHRVGIGVLDAGIYGEMFVQEFTD